VEALYIEMGEVRKVGGVRDSLARHVILNLEHILYEAGLLSYCLVLSRAASPVCTRTRQTTLAIKYDS
jgi:hypothetical protein